MLGTMKSVVLIASLAIFSTEMCTAVRLSDFNTEKLPVSEASTTETLYLTYPYDPLDADHPLNLSKCCKDYQIMDYEAMDCIAYHKPVPWFRPNSTFEKMGYTRLAELEPLRLTHGRNCSSYKSIPQFDLDKPNFYLNLTDNTLWILQDNGTWPIQEDYCLDYVAPKDSYFPFLCSDAPKKEMSRCKKIAGIAYFIGICVTLMCLTISFIVFALVPDLRNLHGRSLMCHMASLMTAFLTYVIIILSKEKLAQIYLCKPIGFTEYWATLSSFFWLNVMCIEIYRVFSKLQRTDGPTGDDNWGRWYIVYALAGSLTLTAIVVIADGVPGSSDRFIKPDFSKICWFQKLSSEMFYLFVPLAAITTFNWVLFLTTAINIWRVKRESKIATLAKSEAQMRKKSTEKLRLYMKLWLVMGLPWTMGIIAALFRCTKCFCIFIRTLNMFQGLYIFLIFVCNKKVKDHLMKCFVKKKRHDLPQIKKKKKKKKKVAPNTKRQTASSSGVTKSTKETSIQLDEISSTKNAKK